RKETRKNFIEFLLSEIVILIVERIASYSIQDLVSIKLNSRFLNEVANEHYVYHKVHWSAFSPKPRWMMNQQAISFMNICIASENLEALYRKGMFNFFNCNDPTALGMVNKAAEGGHRVAEYVLAIISIFEGSKSMREGLMCITNRKKNVPV
ncbi:hypothetical protein EJD97_021805, partial [Solanum chilense]